MARFKVSCNNWTELLLSCCIPYAQFDHPFVELYNFVSKVNSCHWLFQCDLVMNVAPEDGSFSNLAVTDEYDFVFGAVKYWFCRNHPIKNGQGIKLILHIAMLLRTKTKNKDLLARIDNWLPSSCLLCNRIKSLMIYVLC